MENKKKYLEVDRFFGPTVGTFQMPTNLINEINNYVNEVIKDEKKSAELDRGSSLAGQVKQELRIEASFLNKGLGKTIHDAVMEYIKISTNKIITKFQFHSVWVVRQFENEYNPIHHHSGHISGVCYLMVPDNFGGKSQASKKSNPNGCISLIHGSKHFLSPVQRLITPKVGQFTLFPNYLLHTVYPFKGPGERRSLSFNASIDDEIVQKD